MYDDPNQPQPPYEQPPTEYGPPLYGQSPYAAPPPPMPKKSRRGVWIALAIVGAVLVLACGGCAALAIAGVGFFASSLAAPSAAASGYYQAIENQQYKVASSYLDTSSLNQQEQQITAQTFTVAAEARDLADGKVTKFSQTNISVNTTNGVSTASVTMSVTRGSQTYSVQLQMKEDNNVWKITDYNNI
ncbi:MAG TPA: hypothetical protein VNE61_11375 [Ktedonobacteraceae bacterium]|nr:hypothetical protein [Ktedonobacteraceae bacterium]